MARGRRSDRPGPNYENSKGVNLEGMSTDEAWKAIYGGHSVQASKLTADFVNAKGEIEKKEISEKVGIYRSDGTFLATAGKDYGIFQPEDHMKFFDPFIASGMVKLVSGGSLDNGKRIFALAEIVGANDEVVKNDRVGGYLLAYGSYDGSLPRGFKYTGRRFVCWNALASTIRGAGESVKIRHTKNVGEHVLRVQDSIKGAFGEYQKNVEAYKALAGKKMTHKKLTEYIREVLLSHDDRSKIALGEDLSTVKTNLISEVVGLLDTQKGIKEIPAIKGTAWQGYNAITEYITHQMGRNENNRMKSFLFGDGEKMNERALELALDF